MTEDALPRTPIRTVAELRKAVRALQDYGIHYPEEMVHAITKGRSEEEVGTIVGLAWLLNGSKERRELMLAAFDDPRRWRKG